MRCWRGILAALLLVVLSGCVLPPQVSAPPPAACAAEERPVRNRRVFERAWELVNTHFYDKNFAEVDWPEARERHRTAAEAAQNEAQLYAAIYGMLAELKSSHTFVISPTRERQNRLHQSFDVGLTSLDQPDQPTLVIDVVPGSSADEAGVRVGWIQVGDAVLLEPDVPLQIGSKARFQFLDEQDRPRALVLEVREVKRLSRLESRLLPGGYLYLRFDKFNHASLIWVRQQLKEHRKAPGVIVDLRFNPGGLRWALHCLLNEFFPRAIGIGTTIDRTQTKKMTSSLSWWYRESWGAAHYGGQLAVLVSPGSASCSEVFAAVVQDKHRGIVIGPGRTKGAVQLARIFELPDEGSLSVAIQHYLSPAGKTLEGVGVQPDLVVSAITAADLRAGMDTHIKTALAALQNPPSEQKP